MFEGRTIICLLLCFLTGCSIKEDRVDCPSQLIVDCSGFQKVSDSVAVLCWNKDSLVFSIHLGEDGGNWVVTQSVPREKLTVSVVGGIEHSLIKDDFIYAPARSQFDSLYCNSAEIECSSEENVLNVVPHRQFSRVLITSLNNCPYSFLVRSNTSGIYLRDFSSCELAGAFAYEFTPVYQGIWQVNIPRHSFENNSLYLCALIDNEIKVTLPLSKILRDNHYDWEAQELADIIVDFNYTEQNAWFTMEHWSEGNTLDVIL